MGAEFDASQEELIDNYTRQIERLQGMRHDLGEVSATAKRPDGLITVVVGSQGHVEDIQLDPRVYRKLDSGELSRAIMELIGQATSDAAEQTKKIMAPFVPEGLSLDAAPGEDADFTAFLPQSPMVSRKEPGTEGKP
jgi:DNA-binding protein YbaB